MGDVHARPGSHEQRGDKLDEEFAARGDVVHVVGDAADHQEAERGDERKSGPNDLPRAQRRRGEAEEHGDAADHRHGRSVLLAAARHVHQADVRRYSRQPARRDRGQPEREQHEENQAVCCEEDVLVHQNADTMRDQSSVRGIGSAPGAALWSVSMK